MLLSALSVAAHASTTPTFAASVRSDVWVNKLYEQGCANPKDGRRVHVAIEGAGISSDSAIGSLKVNGLDCLALPEDDTSILDWCRAHTSPSGALWVSFHTRDLTWLGDTVAVEVSAKNGNVAVNGTASLVQSDATLALAYVAFRAGGTEAVLHVHNVAQKAHTLSGLTFDGEDVAIPSSVQSLPPGGHAVLVVKLARTKQKAGVWRATLAVDQGDPAGYGGRADTNERFVVNAWPHSTDCALPGGDDAHAAQLKQLGINSIFEKGKDWDKDCGSLQGKTLEQIIQDAAKNASSSFHVMTDYQTCVAVGAAACAAAVDALYVGDEVDGGVDYDHLRVRTKALDAMPYGLTYMGSKTTRNVGTFAGITDIQGSDAYSAACAPTMLGVVFKLPITYSYQYLRNARDNIAPNTFWGYAQLYSDAWTYQPKTPELIMQIGELVQSGTKALMFFQAYNEQLDKQKSASALGDVVQSVRAVGDVIREGDIGGMRFTSSAGDAALVEVIRSPEALLLVVVNTNATGYSNLICHTEVLARHWTFSETNVDSIALSLDSAPDVAALSNWREAKGGKLVPLSDVQVDASGGDVTLSHLALSADVPVRFLLADAKQKTPATKPLEAAPWTTRSIA